MSGMGSTGVAIGTPDPATLMVIILAALAMAVASLAAQRRVPAEATWDDDPESPLGILQRRHARGDMDQAQYERIRDDLVRDGATFGKPRLAPAALQARLGAWAAGLSVGAAIIHFGAAPDHFAEWWGYGAFFVVAGLAQLGYGLLLLRQPRRSWGLYAAGVAGTLAIIGLYVVSRTLGTPPPGPSAGEVEPVGWLDVASKLVEVTLVGILVALLRTPPSRERRAQPVGAATTPGWVKHAPLSRRALLLGFIGGVVAGVAGSRLSRLLPPAARRAAPDSSAGAASSAATLRSSLGEDDTTMSKRT